ncbi:transposase [Terrabacter sp. MAHUQ-38]|uniref:IS110 family transposase n=1 Tax=unclassified Terrabacter TaxID=2630222 RepID=UPI00351C4E99
MDARISARRKPVPSPWAADRARAKGFGGVTVACEPTGHRWRVLAQLAAERGVAFVCVQPAALSWARKTEDLTTDKTDDKDACSSPG